MGLRGIPEAELLFEDLEVPADMVLLPPRASPARLRRADERLQRQRVGAGTVALGIAQGALEQASGFASRARAVRPADLRVPGPAMDAGRHGDAARRRPRALICTRRAARGGQGFPDRDAGGAGQGLRLRDRDQGHQRRAAALRRAPATRATTRWSACARRAHVHHRRRHRADPAHGGRLAPARRSCRRPATATGVAQRRAGSAVRRRPCPRPR
jgi:alkylation response protein AidB-like acyl-CoA dehydrogenase